MRQWYLSLPLACASLVVMFHAANAQVVEIQVQPNGQVQVQPGIVQADVAIARPGYIGPGMNNRLAQMDAIVVGRVVAMEPMDVDASPAAGQPNAKYRVAVVQVSEVIHGVKKDVQMVRVGFIAQNNGPVPPGGNGGGGIQILPAQPAPAIQPAIQPFPGGRRPFFGNIQLEVGQDGIFMLNKHHKESFYVVPGFNNFISRQNNPNFDSEVKMTKVIAKVIENPVAALKAESKEERYAAAAVLITKYRMPNNPTGRPMKQEPIDAAESKLILKGLSEGDWTVGRFNATMPGPFELFNYLGVNQNDGYNPVNIRNQQDLVKAMQTWLEGKGENYVIKRFVVDPNAKGGINPGVIDPPQPVPLPIRPNPKVKINPKNIKVQPLPAPAPRVIPPAQIDPAPAVEIPQLLPAVPAPARRQ